MWKKISIIAFVVFYALAGINHFINPEVYEELIPKWLGNVSTVNTLAGVVELLVAALAIFPKTRKIAGFITIAMLSAFTISHVYFIQLGHCAGDMCLSAWLGWTRLIVIHPLLIYWAYRVSKS